MKQEIRSHNSVAGEYCILVYPLTTTNTHIILFIFTMWVADVLFVSRRLSSLSICVLFTALDQEFNEGSKVL
jgi:hypothetical protein